MKKIPCNRAGDFAKFVIMKKALGYLGAYGCYHLGDILSRPMQWKWLHWLYIPYNRLMIWSVNIQDWAALPKPWRRVAKN